MLQQLRSSAASLVAKLLLVLLIISFAAWGVTGYITQAQQNDTVATVDGEAISGRALSAAFQREINRFRAQGIELTAEQARGLGLMDQVLDRMISERIYEAAGNWLGMGVSKDIVRQVIAQEPAFLDDTGQFSRSQYEFVLRQSGVAEGEFVTEVRRDVVRRQIVNSLDYPDKAPQVLVDRLHRWRGEKRIASFALIPIDATLDVGEPDAEAIAALHEEQADRFTAPERRRLTFIHLDREAAMKEIVVTEEQMRERYQENLAAYTVPERRTVQQMLLPDEATAQRAAAAIREGRSFAAVAKDIAGQNASDIELGTFSKAEFPVPDLWDAIAGLAVGQVSEPRESPFGWHIFKVTGIVPETVTPFEEARAKIEKELKTERSADAMYNMSVTLEDELAGGATLEQAAETLAVPVQHTGLIDSGGNGVDGKPVPGLPGGDFLDTAFITDSGEKSYVTQLPQGDYYVLRVDEVVPSALRPIAEVRDQIVALWKEERRREAARERARSIVKRIENGESLDQIAKSEGLVVKDSKPFDRRGDGAKSAQITPPLVSDMFKIQPGQAAMDQSPDGFTVAQLKTIEPADPSKPGKLPTILGNQMMGDVLAQLNNGLRKRFGVEIDRAALNRL